LNGPTRHLWLAQYSRLRSRRSRSAWSDLP
jgi:hypothetical protein